MILLHEKNIHDFRFFLNKSLPKDRLYVVNAFDRLITGTFALDMLRGPDSDKAEIPLTPNDNEARGDAPEDSDKTGFEHPEQERCDQCKEKCKTFFEVQTDSDPMVIAPTRRLWVCARCKFPHST